MTDIHKTKHFDSNFSKSNWI